MMDLLAEQIRLEEEARARHRAGWLDNIKAAMDEGRASAVPLLQRAMVKAYPTVEAAMQEILNENTRGFGAQYRTHMREIGVKTCATLALSMAMSGAVEKVAVTQHLRSMGQALMAEVVYHKASARGAREAAYMQRVGQDVKRSKSKSPNHIYNKARASAANVGVHMDVLPQRALITIGKMMMRAVEPTGLVKTIRIGGSARQRGTAHFALHDDVIIMLNDWIKLPDMTVGCYPVMIIPPAEINPNGLGGMWHSPGQAATYQAISRLRHKEYRAQKVDPLPIIEPCMMLSGTPFRINKMVLEFLQNNHTGVMGLPAAPVEPKLPFTIPEGVSFAQYISRFPPEMQQRMDAEAHEFKVKTRMYHNEYRRFTTKVQALGSALAEAKRYCAYERIYLPTYADTRGRIYYASSLNPQGIDAIRALLELADAVPLGSEGLFWLKVHVANCFGYDATDFEDRAAWTDKTLPRLREACRLPEAYDSFWSEADSPLCAWAASVELVRALDSGNPEEYPCRVVTQWDATCSGLQHLSAMLRDEVGGAAVNLINSPGRKADIYLKTADAAMAALRESEASCKTELGQWLLKIGIQRAMAKKPVMTYVYGATRHGMVDYYALYLRENNIPLPPGHSLFECAMFIAGIMWDAIPRVVPKAAELMAWLQSLATMVAEKGEYVEVIAPSGLRMVNLYQASKEAAMGLNLMGVHGIKIREWLDKPDSRKCAAAISPNFVHAMDASHMMKVLWEMWNNGVYMVSIHDSFGVAAAHAGLLHRVIREKFVQMYEEHDPIQQLAERYGVEPPAKGQLDIKEVLKSTKFFC
ncbi:DNA-directed RNA polymerase [Escherichia phage Lidtsur]|uniref:DNA-directed RNA polymerase n=1 Tax=Escherichia phage Lidtsur TaxID=2562235 RepID=A0A4D6E0Q3_9CAUD|nr:RNA polymerase [Escherichia phage Lidtsur]QBZ71539.1 DNA-directed RNA polymerase [Escherichia phage Lidtsur]